MAFQIHLPVIAVITLAAVVFAQNGGSSPGNFNPNQFSQQFPQFPGQNQYIPTQISQGSGQFGYPSNFPQPPNQFPQFPQNPNQWQQYPGQLQTQFGQYYPNQFNQQFQQYPNQFQQQFSPGQYQQFATQFGNYGQFPNQFQQQFPGQFGNNGQSPNQFIEVPTQIANYGNIPTNIYNFTQPIPGAGQGSSSGGSSPGGAHPGSQRYPQRYPTYFRGLLYDNLGGVTYVYKKR